MDDQNAKMPVVEDFYAVEMQIVLLEIITLNAIVRKDFILMEKYAKKSNANRIMIVAMTNYAIITCAKLSA